jgi:hypothetical protein
LWTGAATWHVVDAYDTRAACEQARGRQPLQRWQTASGTIKLRQARCLPVGLHPRETE